MADLLLRDVALLDPVAGETRPGASVRVEGDRIVEVAEDGASLEAGDDVRVVAGEGRTLMPGLIDAHVHAAITTMDLAALGRRSPTRVGIEAKAVLEGMLRRGFTTVRDAGGMDAGLADAVALGLIEGPRVFRSGRVLSQTGGHGDLRPAEPDPGPTISAAEIRTSGFSHVADGPDAVRRAAREELKGGATQVKVMAGGGVASPSDPVDMVQYTEEEIRAAVEEASARHTYAFAHAYVPDAVAQAVRAGVRSIEHGNLIDAPTAELMAAEGVWLVPTLVTYDRIARFGRELGFPEGSLRKLDEVLDRGLESVELAATAGVAIGFGTDLLGETHGAQSDEFRIRAEVQAPIDVVRSATVVNAELLGRSGELGVVAPGAGADLLVVDGDPLEDLAVLAEPDKHVDLVVRAGDVIEP